MSLGMSAIAVLFLAFDGVTKLMLVPPVVTGMEQLGYPATSITFTATAVTNAPPGTVFEYGWSTYTPFTVTVQGPTVDLGGLTVGLPNTAVLNSPGFAAPGTFGGGMSGSSGEMNVELFLAPTGGQEYPTQVFFASGPPAGAVALVYAGESTCP